MGLLSTKTIILLIVNHHSIYWIWNSHRTLPHSFTTTFGSVFHFDSVSSPYSAQMFLYIICQQLGYGIPYMPFLSASYIPLLCVGLSVGHLCTACSWGPVRCGILQLPINLVLSTCSCVARINVSGVFPFSLFQPLCVCGTCHAVACPSMMVPTS